MTPRHILLGLAGGGPPTRSAKRVLDERCAGPANALPLPERVGADRSLPDEHPRENRDASYEAPLQHRHTEVGALSAPDIIHGDEWASRDRRAG